MTQDEIIDLATEAGLAYNHDDYPDIWDTYMNVGREEIMAFAKLVADKEQKKWEDQIAVEIHEAVLEEREACAKVIENYPNWIGKTAKTEISNAIRERGEQA